MGDKLVKYNIRSSHSYITLIIFHDTNAEELVYAEALIVTSDFVQYFQIEYNAKIIFTRTDTFSSPLKMGSIGTNLLICFMFIFNLLFAVSVLYPTHSGGDDQVNSIRDLFNLITTRLLPSDLWNLYNRGGPCDSKRLPPLFELPG